YVVLGRPDLGLGRLGRRLEAERGAVQALLLAARAVERLGLLLERAEHPIEAGRAEPRAEQALADPPVAPEQRLAALAEPRVRARARAGRPRRRAGGSRRRGRARAPSRGARRPPRRRASAPSPSAE